MNNPVEINKCPFCGDTNVILDKRKFKHIPINNPTHIYDGEWWFYKCNNCKEQFTTTESDEISMNLTKKKL